MFKWFSRKPAVDVGSPPESVQPAQPLAVIGDIHGRHDLLMRLLGTIDDTQTIICVGDYVDRGDESAAVLRALAARPDIICLLGNHEEMMLNFIDTPEKSGNRWMRYGGLQTIASFGVGGVHEGAGEEVMKQARDALVLAMGDDLIAWLRRLKKYHISGNVAVVHAGADPYIPIEDQSGHILIWGHPAFGTVARPDKMWVIHGHTIVGAPTITHGCVAIDTGAYATGTLTAVMVSSQGFDFKSAP